jgi:hypothetical protein
MVRILSFKKFAFIKRYFENHHTPDDNGVWLIVQTNDIRRFVNTTNERINTFDELKCIIQQKLNQMGYSDVNEIPNGMSVDYQTIY